MMNSNDKIQTQLIPEEWAYNDGSTENIENRLQKDGKRLSSEPNSYYKKKLRCSKLKQNERIRNKKEPGPKQIVNVPAQRLVNDLQSTIEQMDNEGIEENEKITEDVTTETNITVIVENNPTDPNNPRKWKREVTTIRKTTKITKIKEIHT